MAAADPPTAVVEYQGKSPLLAPATLVTFFGDIVRATDHAGILYPSTRCREGVCLVLFPDMQNVTGFVASVHDPKERLHRNAASWAK